MCIRKKKFGVWVMGSCWMVSFNLCILQEISLTQLLASIYAYYHNFSGGRNGNIVDGIPAQDTPSSSQL